MIDKNTNKMTVKKILHLAVFYAKAKLEAETYRDFIGYFWWILDPLFGVAVYYLLFKVILHRGQEDYIPFLFLGLITWKWLHDSIAKSAGSILSNIELCKKIKISKIIFPIAEVFYNSWKFIIIFILVLIVYPFLGFQLNINFVFIPFLLFTSFVFIIGSSVFLASLIPLFPDMLFFVGYFFKLIFYPSCILFAPSRIPEKYQFLVTYNPIAGQVESYRNIIMHSSAPRWESLFFSIFLGLLFGLIGRYMVNKYERIYPKIV